MVFRSFLAAIIGLSIGSQVTAFEASNLLFELNCKCQEEMLACKPSLTRTDGQVFRSEPFTYRAKNQETCLIHLYRMSGHNRQTFAMPGRHAEAEFYQLNLGLVRPHIETCEFVGQRDSIEAWRCHLETAMVLRSSAEETPITGNVVIVTSAEDYEAFASDQPKWSAGMTLLQIKELIEQFTKKDAIFTRISQ